MRTTARTSRLLLSAACGAALLSACASAPVRGEPAPAEPSGPAAPQGKLTEAAPDAAPPSAGRAGARPAAAPVVTDPPQRARLAFAEGARLADAGDAAGALAAFERARQDDPSLAWAAYDAGLMKERLGDDAGARAAWLALVDASPGFAPAAQSLARSWLRAGQRAEAEQALRERLAKGDGVALRVGLAEVLLAGGQPDAAEAECRAALKQDEKNVPAMVVLASAYARKNRHELARMVLENARQVNEADPAVWNRLGFVELALGNRAQALEHFRTAASLRPDYPEAHANYGTLLAEADDFSGAVQELELAVKHAPRLAGAWLSLGNARRGLQQFEQAEAAYRKALELEPGLNDAHFNLAVLYLDVEKADLPTLQRLEQGLAWFDTYEKNGGVEPRVAEYRKDAGRSIERERKRLAREEKDRARKEAEAKRKADEEAKRQAEEAAAAKAAAEQAAAEQAAAEKAAAEKAAAEQAAAAATPTPTASPAPSAVESTPPTPPPSEPAAPAEKPASPPADPAPEPAPAGAAAAPASDPAPAPAAAPAGEERGDK